MSSGRAHRPERPRPGSTEAGEFLQRLKDRSGRTYDSIAHRTGLSRSTVHRQCRGEVVPETFAPLEAIARACGAERSELLELHRLWSGEPARRLAVAPLSPAAPVQPDPEPSSAAPPGPATSSWTAPKGRAAAAAIVIVLVAWVLQASRPQEEPGNTGPSAGREQRVLGPAWTDSERRVPPDFFGVTMNSDTGAMPDFRIGSVRFWDGGTRWSELEPARDRYQWQTLDRLVLGAEKAGLSSLFTFGGTPEWASPDGPRMAYEDGARAAPPDDLTDWDRIVRAVSSRYRGRIQAYELWVLAPSPLYYAGSAATLATMTRRAAQILRSTDPAATVVCPSIGELWQEESRRFLKDFASFGGYEHCDVAGVKLHPRDFGQPPETIIELTGLIDRALHDTGTHPRIWSTGTTYRIASAQRLDERTARNYAVRLYLVTLYARYDRMYFYNWGGHKIPIVLQAEGGPPTAAARYVEQLQRWLSVARIYSCGTGPDDGLPARVWRCRFRVGESAAEADIMWTSSGAASLPAPAAGVQRFLDGRETPLGAGEPRSISEEPTMALYQPAAASTGGRGQER
jgi:hypothetical protein